MNPRNLRDYTSPDACPAEKPRLEDMSAETVGLHGAIDAAMKRSGLAYLHPEGETLQLDLLGSPRMIAWQESKAQRVFEGEECWSGLSQVYARYGTETTRALLEKVREWEGGARAAVLTDCGMEACALLFDVLLRRGQHAILMRQVYNKTKKYLERLLEQLDGTSLTVVDDGDYPALEKAIRPETSIVFAETYTNPLMRAVDPERLGGLIEAARDGGAKKLRLIVDSTIATPWSLRRPLLSFPGVDFVVASGTKALAGADRDLWGYIASNRVDALNEVMDLQAMRGGILDWRRARVIADGLDKARRRFEQRCGTATEVADFLSRHSRVSEVFHPSLPDHPDLATVDRHYSLSGSLMSFRIAGADEDETRDFCDVLATTVVPRYALSFDGLATKLNHHLTVSEYFTPVEELERAGIDRLVRLGVGLEAAEDIIACLNWALWHYKDVPAEDVARWRRDRARELGIYPEAPEA
ncbi:MAG: PLP-dependent transferase [Planctomycetota bacterium]|nr:PLP-dependent transferase [Planctomycetota bacterium]